jgi:hypothetical protein
MSDWLAQSSHTQLFLSRLHGDMIGPGVIIAHGAAAGGVEGGRGTMRLGLFARKDS